VFVIENVWHIRRCRYAGHYSSSSFKVDSIALVAFLILVIRGRFNYRNAVALFMHLIALRVR